MNRIFACLLGASLLGSVAAGTYVYLSSRADAPTVNQALGVSERHFLKRLYPSSPGDADAESPPIESSVQIDDHIYQNLADGSTVDIVLKPGTVDQIKSSQSYYPEKPGENGRRKHVRQLNNVLPGLAFDEEVRRLDGTLSKHTELGDDQKKHVVAYGADGNTYVGEQFFAPRLYYGLNLLKEERWRMDAGHTLKYRDVFNPDETRTVTEYDDQMRALKIIQWPQNMTAWHSTVVEYYPDTFKKRLQAYCDSSFNSVDIFRPDGTQAYKLQLSNSMVVVSYYDQEGKYVRLEQTLWRHEHKVKDSKFYTYEVYIAKAFDEQGQETREVTLRSGGQANVFDEEFFNVTVDGITYKEVDKIYDMDAGYQMRVTYWKDKAEYPPTKVEEHKPAEKIGPAPVPEEWLKIGLEIPDDLPVPPPDTGGHP